MKEDLIRIQNGIFQSEGHAYCFDIEISKGECIGIYVDEHITSGTTYLDIFKGYAQPKSGKPFIYGNRVGMLELQRWISQNTMVIDKNRFDSKELTIRDFLLSLSKSTHGKQRHAMKQKLYAADSQALLSRIGLAAQWERKLVSLSLLEYTCLSLFRVWFWESELFVLDRLTEVLRQKDLETLMSFVQELQRYGTAVFIFDMDEAFLYRYTNRIDVIKNRKTCYRLYPDAYDARLYEIMGWKRRSRNIESSNRCEHREVVVTALNLKFHSLRPLNFQIHSGEIAFLRDENYHIVSQIKDCFLGESSWQSGGFYLDGQDFAYHKLKKLIGTKIGIQIERPDRPGGVLFDQLTALDNLCISLCPKAGQHMIHTRIVNSILQEACRWFPKESLLRPLSAWSLPERLRFSYYKWYMLNPRLLICFLPFAGQEPAHHEMIIDLLVACARRGMAIWVISSEISMICEKTQNKEFLYRLRDLSGA